MYLSILCYRSLFLPANLNSHFLPHRALQRPCPFPKRTYATHIRIQLIPLSVRRLFCCIVHVAQYHHAHFEHATPCRTHLCWSWWPTDLEWAPRLGFAHSGNHCTAGARFRVQPSETNLIWEANRKNSDTISWIAFALFCAKNMRWLVLVWLTQQPSTVATWRAICWIKPFMWVRSIVECVLSTWALRSCWAINEIASVFLVFAVVAGSCHLFAICPHVHNIHLVSSIHHLMASIKFARCNHSPFKLWNGCLQLLSIYHDLHVICERFRLESDAANTRSDRIEYILDPVLSVSHHVHLKTKIHAKNAPPINHMRVQRVYVSFL